MALTDSLLLLALQLLLSLLQRECTKTMFAAAFLAAVLLMQLPHQVAVALAAVAAVVAAVEVGGVGVVAIVAVVVLWSEDAFADR